MYYRLPHYALAALLATSSAAHALEVGEIQVQSALNQLFDATIPLPTLAPEDLNGVSIKIASPTMFNEFGLDRSPTLAHLVFSIQYDAEGRVYVKAVSTQPIREPSLALLLEFSWPRGKTFREFTVLLDPIRRLAERPSSRSKTVLNTKEALETTTAPSYKPGDFYGPVLAGEGLWGIALKLRPEGITREQMMQALFQVNPQAFANENVSGLKIGAKLRIPNYKEIADTTGSPIALQLAALEAGPTAVPALDSSAPSVDTPTTFPLKPSIIPEPLIITGAPESSSTAASPVTIFKTTALPLQTDNTATLLASPTPLLSMAAADFLLDAEQLLAAALPTNSLEKTPLMPADIHEIIAEDGQENGTEPAKISSLPVDTSALLSALAAESAHDDALQLLASILQTPNIKQTPLPTFDAENTAAIIPEAIVAPAPVKQDEAVIVLLPILDLDMRLDAIQLLERILPAPALKTTPIPAATAVRRSLENANNLVNNLDAAPTTISSPSVKNTDSSKQPGKPLDKPSKVSKEYGPVANNERLWDIAGKVNSNPNLSKDVVMKALFMANPQAFTKPNIDSLKIGVILRIPTEEEIVKYAATPEVKPASEVVQKKPQSPSPKNK